MKKFNIGDVLILREQATDEIVLGVADHEFPGSITVTLRDRDNSPLPADYTAFLGDSKVSCNRRYEYLENLGQL